MKRTQPISIVSVNISEKKGTVKTPVSEVVLTETGIPEDAHSGGWHRQVSILSIEQIDDFSTRFGRTVRPGEFAENITTSGIDLREVALLDRFVIGDAELEVTQIGKECHGDACAIFREVGACVMPNEGIFSRVIRGGRVKPGDVACHFPKMLRFAIITLSDRASKGQSDDRSGPEIQEILERRFSQNRWRTAYKRLVLPDDAPALKSAVEQACSEGVDFIFTTGGTGIGPRDITPDVLEPMFDRKLPGVMEHIRLKYGADNPKALLSRSTAGMIGGVLVYALPGSVRAVREYMEEIQKTLEHCLYMIHGIDVHEKHAKI
ncbi:MAG: molybdenum cofactor synthesis domain-containing protein [Candidatus Latescibacterota bacterium]